MHTIKGLESEVVVSEYCIRAGTSGPMGTLYHGDAEKISDFLSEPDGELDIFGCIHHIHIEFARDIFTMTIQFMDSIGAVKFGHKQARDVIFALAGVKPYSNGPGR